MSSSAALQSDVGVPVEEVPAVDVVNVTVAIIVEPVDHLAPVRPELWCEFGVLEVEAVVDDGHDHAGIAPLDIPCLGNTKGWHVPLVDDLGIVRERGDVFGAACGATCPQYQREEDERRECG